MIKQKELEKILGTTEAHICHVGGYVCVEETGEKKLSFAVVAYPFSPMSGYERKIVSYKEEYLPAVMAMVEYAKARLEE